MNDVGPMVVIFNSIKLVSSLLVEPENGNHSMPNKQPSKRAGIRLD